MGKMSVQEIFARTRYKLIRKIASGGMADVYEARQLGTEGFEKTVAIKCILEKFTRDREFVEMFIAEAKLVADLIHQHIVQIYHLGKIANTYYIVMEYIHGVTLAEFMSKHLELGTKVPIEIGTYIISRLCRALEYAHAKRDKKGALLGIVHRDISPRNVMINTEGVVKLGDFGIAKARHLMRDREGEVLFGKIQYMSPEQSQFLNTDNRSDIYSLGVLFFELMTGKELFSDDDTTKLLEKVANPEIPQPSRVNPEIPSEVEKIMLKALAKDPARRYQNIGRMAYELERFMYHDRFGPTFVTLEKYLKRLFPELDIERRVREHQYDPAIEVSLQHDIP